MTFCPRIDYNILRSRLYQRIYFLEKHIELKYSYEKNYIPSYRTSLFEDMKNFVNLFP